MLAKQIALPSTVCSAGTAIEKEAHEASTERNGAGRYRNKTVAWRGVSYGFRFRQREGGRSNLEGCERGASLLLRGSGGRGA
jgi:hypothetical protein